MQIVCPNCATSYRVETSSLGAAGRSVRCVRCRNVWFAHDPEALPAIAQAHRSDIEALASSIVTVAYDDPVPQTSAADELEYTFEPQPAFADPPAATGDADHPPALAPDTSGPWPQLGEPITIADAPGLVPMQQNAELPQDAAAGGLPEDIETFAARRMREKARKRSRWASSGLPLAILALVALNAALIGWRADVVKVAPQTASLYAAIGLPVNLRGLSFTDVKTMTESHDGVQVLVVEGTIASTSQRVVEVPRLRFSVRNRSGQEVYAWTALPGRSGLAPGETLAFRSRLASPPPDTAEVLVRFFNRRDLVAGIK
ncbi:MAG: hypothetical protein QOI40_232 [Alphaproteobacteria bacterium]|nr:hypothetical protein [Alphaproteobacteria bacterium]